MHNFDIYLTFSILRKQYPLHINKLIFKYFLDNETNPFGLKDCEEISSNGQCYYKNNKFILIHNGTEYELDYNKLNIFHITKTNNKVLTYFQSNDEYLIVDNYSFFSIYKIIDLINDIYTYTEQIQKFYNGLTKFYILNNYIYLFDNNGKYIFYINEPMRAYLPYNENLKQIFITKNYEFYYLNNQIIKKNISTDENEYFNFNHTIYYAFYTFYIRNNVIFMYNKNKLYCLGRT